MSAGGTPCGACKFLRRKCVADCVFAPYFDSDEGTAHFTAVHKVFGASNTSKLLSKIPANRRLDAVFTLLYEALARISDPVYGCVGHIFALQNQIMNLQTELAVVQHQLSTLQNLLPPNLQNNSSTEPTYSSNALLVDNNNENNVPSSLLHNDFTMSKQEQQRQDHMKISTEAMNFTALLGMEDCVVDEGGDLNSLAREFFSRYLTGSNARPSSPAI